MKVLLTLNEYAKLKGLSEIAIRKQISKNYTKSIKVDETLYIIHEDTRLSKAQQLIKNKNAQLRELKLKIQVQEEQNNDKYLLELESQIIKLEKRNKKLEKKNDKLEDKKDSIYEKALASFINQNKQLN